MSAAQAPPAQPLTPPDQTGGPSAAQAPPQLGQEQPSLLFSVPHPPSDAARWPLMVEAPFLANAPPAADAEVPAAGTKTARAELFLVFRRGRWSSRLTLPRTLPSTLVGMGWRKGRKAAKYRSGLGAGLPLC
jgi:hypothetical protein